MFFHESTRLRFKRSFVRVLRAFIVLSGCFLFAASSFGHEGLHVYKIGFGQISFQEMLDEISSVKVVFVGEKHGNTDHHIIQLNVIKGLHQKDIQLAIGLEMFMASDQEKLDGWVAGKIKEKAFVKIFKKNWGIDWKYYRDIFVYARDNSIPLTGLNVPREITKKVARQGFQSLNREELEALPPGITCDLDQRYKDFIRRLFKVKGGKEKAFNYFCEAQVVWDQSMAWHLADSLEKNPSRKTVVLAGAIHAWKYGISRQLQRYATVKDSVILPDLPGDYHTITIKDADYLALNN